MAKPVSEIVVALERDNSVFGLLAVDIFCRFRYVQNCHAMLVASQQSLEDLVRSAGSTAAALFSEDWR